MIPKKVFLPKQLAEDMKYTSSARIYEYISTESLLEFIQSHSLDNNPLSFDKFTQGQNDILNCLLLYISLETIID